VLSAQTDIVIVQEELSGDLISQTMSDEIDVNVPVVETEGAEAEEVVVAPEGDATSEVPAEEAPVAAE
jgi:hypothetical protein